MGKRVDFHPIFDCDIREAAPWYDRRSRALGDAFVRQTKAKVADIQRNPQQYVRLFGVERLHPLF